MATQRQEGKPVDLQKLQDGIMVGAENPMSALDALKEFEKVESNRLQQINAEYLNLSRNTSYSFIFTGITTATIKGKEIECAKLLQGDGMNLICGATVLVKSLKGVTNFPALVRIDVREKVEGKEGEYFDMSVSVVPIPKSEKLPF